MRQPTISMQGVATFKELYSSSAIYQRTRTQGQDLRVNGSIRLTLYLSDTYSWTSMLDASSSFERTPPVFIYDELLSPLKQFLEPDPNAKILNHGFYVKKEARND